MIKYQNYKHYKLPITINPLDYGKLILKIDSLNLFILQITRTNIALLTQDGLTNQVKVYKEGEFRFEYKDYKLSNNSFTRTIDSTRFKFRDRVLIESAEIVIILILAIIIIFFIIFPDSNINMAMSAFSSTLKREFSYESKKYYRNTWNSIFFKLDNQIFSIKLLEFYFENFWKIVSPKILEGCHIFILLKFQFAENNFHNIGKLIRLDHNNYKSFITQIEDYMESMGDYYNQSPITKIIFSYGFKRGEITEIFSKSEINLINFKDMKLPISIDPNDYGKILETFKTSEVNIYTIQDNLGRSIIFKEFEKENIVNYYKNGNSILEFKDIKFSDNKFLRNLGRSKLFFENGNKSLEIKSIVIPFISKTKKDKVEINNFITLDIETFGTNELIPYLISFYDGKKSYSFYFSEYNSIELMMEACFKELFIRKYNKYQVYIHNLTKFDIIFLLKYLVKHVSVKPLIHKGRIIQIQINYGPDLQYSLNLKDSYLILLASLSKLSKSFAIDTPKSVFPHKFVSTNNLNYIGKVPDIKYFYNISKEQYLNYCEQFKDNNWSLRDEAIKYCEIDCISLYQIILKFNSLIFNLFNKNIHRYPTLPSLAFAIFRSSFMDEENIPKLTDNIAADIREGYTGGSTDMFIPYGKNIKCYDVNSLYPSVMINQDMPIGKIESFNGDIRKIDPSAFGFFYVKVNCPVDIMHPILQIKHKVKNGIKTISPVGTWSMWIFSVEMDNAMKYGYTFEIMKGYKFEKSIIFKNYIDFLYSLRCQYSKSHPLNLIAKILLNSLYGRFGMNEIIMKYEIFSKEEFSQITEDKILDFIEIEDHILVGLEIESNEDSHNISIGVAAAITAYSRIHMSQFKNNPNIRLFYTDTDSIYTDSELDDSFIDNKILGKLKLECISEEAIFLGPKIYCLQTENGLITKVKGLKDTSTLDIKDFKDLLIRDHKIELHHDKWFRKLSEGKINIKDQIYTLIATDNKRKFIYDHNKIVGTKPIILNL